MTTLTRILLALTLVSSALAHDYTPGPVQSVPILLTGGDLHTISDGFMPSTDLLFENGRITQIGKGLVAPEGAEIIDVTGEQVYPGLIALGTSLGLLEIGEVLATDDRREVGDINPDVLPHMAYNPDSEIIPTTRSNGIAYAMVIPSGSLLAGRPCLMNLDAWTKEDAALVDDLGLYLSIPGMSLRGGWWDQRPAEKRKEATRKRMAALEQAFDDAQAYRKAKEADPNIKIDSRWEAMLPVLRGEKTVFAAADDYRQIEYAVDFAARRGLKLVIMGGKEAWKMADLLAEHNVPVVYSDAYGLPQRQDDPYDQAFRALGILNAAGVKVSYLSRGATGVQNLPFNAAMATAWGLPPDIALRGLTLTAAEILGVDDQIGSLEVGKRASIVVSEGDITDHITHGVTRMFIDGRVADLNSKHKELYEKYRNRTVNR